MVSTIYLATGRHGGIPGAAEMGERLHFADGHMRGSQPQQEGNPVHVGSCVTPLTIGRAGDRRNQADTLVIAQRVGGQASAFGNFVDAEMRFRGNILKVRARSKSSESVVRGRMMRCDHIGMQDRDIEEGDVAKFLEAMFDFHRGLKFAQAFVIRRDNNDA